MRFDPPLQHGKLIKRYKRFLADVELDNGEVITMHCPNTGSMKNCQTPGSRIWYSRASNPKRKYPHTWEIVEVDSLDLVGINTHRANQLVVEAIKAGTVQQLRGYGQLETEVPYGEQSSRIDILLRGATSRVNQADCYVEVKNVSLGMGKGLGLFPDAVTRRGQKHLQELMSMSSRGYRAVLFFCVQHSGIQRVSPADEIDPEYGRLLRQAASQGVELMAYGAVYDMDASMIQLSRELTLVL
ncbi:MAG: DNA/RNA nuclease SfsA [Pseudomonadales bacterium]|jgi:sugar fermentation stimulation protein A|nr:DNA/RNA nuclease SfsA [Pseudomonadales bacterium]